MPPDARRAGEDHMVEGELRESDADVGIASEHRHFAFVEIAGHQPRSEEHTSELQSLMRISYAVFCLKKKINIKNSSPSNYTPIYSHTKIIHLTHIQYQPRPSTIPIPSH